MKEQLNRIKEKLATIHQYDKDFEVFGADSHEYQVGPCVPVTAVTAFEQKCTIELPEAYVAFVTQIGNGNTGDNAYMGSAAGPYYGIYPLGDGLEDLPVGDNKKYLSYPCLLRPDLTEEEWTTLTAGMHEEELSDEAYEAIVGSLYGGILPIGTQGCAITTGLILNGTYRGRIVYLNEDYQPIFAYEAHFLDWYERWLDEIISGDLLGEHTGWFGYRRGGTSAFLWDAFQTSTAEKEQVEYLEGLINKRNLDDEIVQAIVQAIPTATTTIKENLLSILAKTKYDLALPFLLREVEVNLLFVLQKIHWYGKSEADWLPVLERYKDGIEEEETYRFYTYIAIKATEDFAHLILPGLSSSLASIRSQAIYTLGKLKEKQAYASYFIAALEDDDESVVLYSLQALRGVVDERLPQAYAAVYHKYKNSEEENYILVNLKHRLTEIQMNITDLEG